MRPSMDRLLGKDLEEQRSRGDQGVQHPDDDLQRKDTSVPPLVAQKGVAPTYDGGKGQSGGDVTEPAGQGAVSGSRGKGPC
jgi:hypothetical protein